MTARDEVGRAIIQLAADDWLLEQLLDVPWIWRTAATPSPMVIRDR
jgi:hypothetical protein